MPNPTWPPSLPTDFLINTVQKSQRPVVVRSKMESGKTYARRRFTKAIKTIDGGKLTMTKTQCDTFWAFFNDECYAGAIPFDWKDPRTQLAGTFLILNEPVEKHIAGDYWSVTFDLEARIT